MGRMRAECIQKTVRWADKCGFLCSHQIRVTSPAADGNLRLCHVIITLDYVRKFVCV